MRRSTATVLSTLTVLGALAAGVAPASAETASVSDPENDVTQFSASALRGRSGATTDITDTTVDHRNRNVFATVSVVDVERSDSATNRLALRLKTPELQAVAAVRYNTAITETRLTVDGSPFLCEGLDAVVNPELNTVKFTVPRRCLGSPETVRFGSRMVVRFEEGTQADDGGRPTPVTSPKQTIKLSAERLARG